MNIQDSLDTIDGRGEQELRLEQSLAELQADYAYLADRLDARCLDIINKKFQTALPCFQGNAGAYDALDAMRRDAHREVCLWLQFTCNKNKQ